MAVMDIGYESVLLTGLRAAASNANRNNLIWDIFLGTIMATEELGTYRVRCDGDSTTLTITSLAGTLTPGTRVYVIKVPPGTLYILGPTITLLRPAPIPPVPTPEPIDVTLDPVGPVPIVDIDADAGGGELVLVLEDFFERTVTGVQEWGTPDLGGDWITDFFGDGQIIQVDSGTGQIVNDSTYDSNTATLIAGISDIKNYAIEMIGMTVVPGTIGEFVVQVTARDSDNSITIFWATDGTAEAFLYTGLASVGPVAIPDVDASQPIDVYMTCTNDSIQVWTALTSVGLNLSDPPLFDETAFDGFAGSITFNYDGDEPGEESSNTYDEIRIWEIT